MGFFKKATTSYPARRNRINQQHHPATVTPPAPSNYGAQNPTPMPASVYQANGTPVAPSRPATSPAAAAPTTTAAVLAAAYNPSSYGGFPDSSAPVSAPVQAQVYVPGQRAATVATVAPVVATAYVPGGAPATAAHATAAPAQATAYNPNGAAAVASAPSAPPATNPLYNMGTSYNNGNAGYNTDESSFWECSICTFPNLRSEANCKGCGSPIPPGMLMSAATAQQQQEQQQQQRPPQAPASYGGAAGGLNSQFNNMSLGGANAGAGAAAAAGGVMRVHVPNGMRPGQKIKVRSPDGKEVVKQIPPQSEWQHDERGPFFRMQYGPQAAVTGTAVAAAASYGGRQTTAHEVPPPHSTTWREFHTTAPTRYAPPPLGSQSVPHSPLGNGSGIPPNGRHKALIIGINYTGTRAQLRGCINDAKNMQGMLQRNGFPNDGSHMLLLTDERSRGWEYQPTVDNIMKAFAWFMRDVRRGDVLFFHFSGHGGQVPDKTGHEIDGYNETIIPVDYERKGQVSDDILWGSLVYKLPEGARITALMDMCHSGTGLDLPYDYNVDNGRWKEDVNPAHSAGDVVLFSGCEDSQTSADVSGGFGKQAGGAMTQAFMGAYETTARGALSTYHEFLVNVKKQLRKKKFSQRPQMTSSQQFDPTSRIFSLGYESRSGGIPSTIEPNHNPKVGRMKNRHVRPARQGFGGGGGGNIFGMAAGAVGAALLADALFDL